MANSKTHAHISENGDSDYSVSIHVSDHHLTGDEPESFDGAKNLGPSPYDFLITALGTCTVMTMRWYAKQKKLPLEHAEARLTYEKVDGQDIFTKYLSIKGDNLTEEQREKLLSVAAKCPVQKTLTSDILINTIWEGDSL